MTGPFFQDTLDDDDAPKMLPPPEAEDFSDVTHGGTDEALVERSPGSVPTVVAVADSSPSAGKKGPHWPLHAQQFLLNWIIENGLPTSAGSNGWERVTGEIDRATGFCPPPGTAKQQWWNLKKRRLQLDIDRQREVDINGVAAPPTDAVAGDKRDSPENTACDGLVLIQQQKRRRGRRPAADTLEDLLRKAMAKEQEQTGKVVNGRVTPVKATPLPGAAPSVGAAAAAPATATISAAQAAKTKRDKMREIHAQRAQEKAAKDPLTAILKLTAHNAKERKKEKQEDRLFKVALLKLISGNTDRSMEGLLVSAASSDEETDD